MARSFESLTKALRRLQREARSEHPARLYAVRPTICIDIGELLLELRARRERIMAWICLLNEEVNRSRGDGMSRKRRSRLSGSGIASRAG